MTAPTQVAPGLRCSGDDDWPVETWWLDNPKRRNAVTPEALSWIAERCATLRGQTVVLRGTGPDAFCAGFDLTALAKPPPPGTFVDAPLCEATGAMRVADATFVAALSGYAIGAGVELACACDLRVARRGMFFAIPAAELGVVYHADGVATMRAVFGPAVLRRLVLLGDRVSAEDANVAGALVRCVEAEGFEDALADVVDRLRRGAPLSIAGNRDLLRTLDRGPLTPAGRSEHDDRRREAYASEDHREARAARVERRPPKFTGR